MRKTVTGHCTPGCGACCRILAMPMRKGWPRSLLRQGLVPVPERVTAEGAHFWQARGIEPRGSALKVPNPQNGFWLGKYAGRDAVFYRSPCPQLDDQGMCKLFGTPERPAVCNRWPAPWDDLVGVEDVCTYRIEEATADAASDGGDPGVGNIPSGEENDATARR